MQSLLLSIWTTLKHLPQNFKHSHLGEYMKITQNGSSLFISEGSGINGVTINGVTYLGNNITIGDGSITVNGKCVEDSSKQFFINITGDVNVVESQSARVNISGAAGEVSTGSGDVACGNVSGNIRTGSGDVQCKEVSGNIRTGSGDVYKS